jgi:hypothetical protein
LWRLCLSIRQHARASEKSKGIVCQAKDALTGKSNVTQIEHAQINEAVAQGIAANVDDFMVHGLAFNHI